MKKGKPKDLSGIEVVELFLEVYGDIYERHLGEDDHEYFTLLTNLWKV